MTMLMLTTVLMLCQIAWSTPARADIDQLSLFPLSGRVLTESYLPLDNPVPNKPFQQLSASLWLESDPKLSDNTGAKLVYRSDALDAQYSSVSGASTASHAELGLSEGYVYTRKEGLELKVGQQIISWGKSDGINPTDFHSAKNYSFFTSDDEVRRRGGVSTLFNVTPNAGDSPLAFTTVWTPVFAQSKHLIGPNVISPPTTLADPQTPPVTFQNGEIAEKISYYGKGWDASLSYFNGWSHLPELQLTSYSIVAGTPFVNLAQVFRRVWAVGADASYGAEKWVFRAESAYIVTANDDGSNPLTTPSHWDSVIGAERPLGEFFRIQAQLVLRYFPRYQPPSAASGPDPVTTQVNQAVAAANALLLQYQDPSRPAGTLRVSYSNEPKGVDAEIFFLQNFAGGDFMLRPKISYAWSDALKTSGGVELYNGPANRPLGALHGYSAAFLETKYTF